MSTTTLSTYERSAIDFLKATNTTFKVKYLKRDYRFDDDKETRDIYQITLKNNNGSYRFKFGQSIFNSEKGIEPTAYDVLSSIEKHGYENDFEWFCSNLGYDPDSRKAYKIYQAVEKEYANLCRLFSKEELELMQEIQ